MEIADYIVAEDRELVRLALGGTDGADDLLQETFIKVYINLHRYRPDYTFGQWLYTIARNTFIDYVRKRQEELPIDERFASPPSPTPSPASTVCC